MIHLVECPRDAMQGWKTFIPTDKKIAYLNKLLQVGFHTLDCGSFVSARAIPQMADTKEE
jgi:hydroxymethylglutaryl-CoA lyase